MKIHCSHDELVRVTDLKPHPKNRNQHPEEQVTRLASILKYQGWRYPVKVSKRSGYVTSGHGRISAAKENGWEYVPVNFQDYESEEQEYADVTSDNAIASWAELDLAGINSDLADLGPDFDIDLLGIEGFVLEPADKHQGDPDDVPPVPEVATTKPGDLFSLGDHRLLCGDATSREDVERLMDGEKADMVFTDPPYGDGHAQMWCDFSKGKGKGSIVAKVDTIAGDDNITWLEDVFPNIEHVCKSAAPKFVWFKWSKWEEIKGYATCFGNPKTVIVWDRGWIAAAVFRFNPVHEFCFYWGTLGDKHSVSNLTNVWRQKKDRSLRDLHPTIKPIEIIAPAIEVCIPSGALVLDAFLGSGSTLIACEKTNRRCYGMEIDPLYCDVIIKRWETYTGKKAVLIEKAG